VTVLDKLPFRQIWVIDFEFRPKSVTRSAFEFIENSGERPAPVCGVFKEVRSGQVILLVDVWLWRTSLAGLPHQIFRRTTFG